MLLEMITKKILDFDYQLKRVFGEFIKPNEYDTRDNLNGKYDIIFCHRESAQDNFESIKPYCNTDTKIVVDITTESGNLQIFLDKFKNLTDTEPFDFYLIIDTDLSNYKNQNNLKYKILDGFDLVFYAFLNEYSDNNLHNDNNIFSDTNGFISLNNSCRLHRIFLFLELLKRKMPLDNCSFLFSTGGPNGSKYNSEVYYGGIDNLLNSNLISISDSELLKSINVPVILDYDLSHYSYIDNQINESYKFILNLVTENVIGMTGGDTSEYGLITFTEKIIKPFLAKQIPLFIALPGLQSELRTMGFDLFDDIIDTSFENELDSSMRIQMIITQLENLLKLDLIEFKSKNENRFQHNFDLLKTLTRSGRDNVKSFLYDTILK